MLAHTRHSENLATMNQIKRQNHILRSNTNNKPMWIEPKRSFLFLWVEMGLDIYNDVWDNSFWSWLSDCQVFSRLTRSLVNFIGELLHERRKLLSTISHTLFRYSPSFSGKHTRTNPDRSMRRCCSRTAYLNPVFWVHVDVRYRRWYCTLVYGSSSISYDVIPGKHARWEHDFNSPVSSVNIATLITHLDQFVIHMPID